MRRVPHGARGLKSFPVSRTSSWSMSSRPTRGAWIEIVNAIKNKAEMFGRVPHGARGLKSHPVRDPHTADAVASHTGRVD